MPNFAGHWFTVIAIFVNYISFSEGLISLESNYNPIGNSALSTHCISLSLKSNDEQLFSHLFVGSEMVASDDLYFINRYVADRLGGADESLKICVQIAPAKVSSNMTDDLPPSRITKLESAVSFQSLSPAVPIPYLPTRVESTKLAYSLYRASSKSIIVYINSLLDSAPNTTACKQSTSTSLPGSGHCNFRSAIDYCADIMANTTVSQCSVHFPITSDVIFINPSLGDVSMTDVGGTLTLEGNGCTLAMAPHLSNYSRFLFLFGPAYQSLHLHVAIRNMTVDSFGDFITPGGALYAAYLSSLTMEDVTFINNKGNMGGSMYVIWSGGIHISRCVFSNGYADEEGGGIYFMNTANGTLVHNVFRNNSGYYGAGAISFSTGNKNMTISDSTFFDSASDGGGAILIFTKNDHITIENCLFERTKGYYGGVIFVYDSNTYVMIAGSIFNISESEYGGALFSSEYNSDMHIENCVFIDTIASDGGTLTFYSQNDNVRINNCTFTKSRPSVNIGHYYGGAIYLETLNWYMEINDCTFQYHSVWYKGGAIYVNLRNRGLEIKRCAFIDSHADRDGGAVYIETDNSQVLISECVFINTTTETNGGSIYFVTGNDNIHIINCTFENSTAKLVGGAIGFNSGNTLVDISGCLFFGSNAESVGGAIYLDYDNTEIHITSTEFIACGALNGGAIYAGSHNDDIQLSKVSFIGNTAENDGGAVLFRDSNTNGIFDRVTFRSNTAGQYGGGLAASCSNVGIIVQYSSFIENESGYGGGGIHSTLANSDLAVLESVFDGNIGFNGGGAYFGSDHKGISLSGCTFEDNMGTSYGGGLYVFQFNSEVSIEGSMLIGNAAAQQGGGLFVLSTDLQITNSLVANNTAGTGAGVCAPAVDKVSVFSSVFHSNIATSMYGGMYINAASAINISGTNFTMNRAALGAGLGVSFSYGMVLYNCAFIDNIAISQAGGLYVNVVDDMFINYSYFEGNVAEFGSGSAIQLSGSSYATVVGNYFVDNRAPYGGGTVYWYSNSMNEPVGLQDVSSLSQQQLSSWVLDASSSLNYFGDGNVALYGDTVE
jgi:predicted outer membrane repeat protein